MNPAVVKPRNSRPLYAIPELQHCAQFRVTNKWMPGNPCARPHIRKKMKQYSWDKDDGKDKDAKNAPRVSPAAPASTVHFPRTALRDWIPDTRTAELSSGTEAPSPHGPNRRRLGAKALMHRLNRMENNGGLP